jgi:K+-sensing histidine kinase KdpD
LTSGCQDLKGQQVRFRFEVTDAGIGIPQERQAELFAAFMQADLSTIRRYGGARPNLAICRRLVGAMGSTIGLTSRSENGNTFWFDLPSGWATTSRSRTRRLLSR